MGQLVLGCEIRLLDTPMISTDGRDSIYFTVPTTLGAGAVQNPETHQRVHVLDCR